MRNRPHEKCGKFVNVQILADLLDVRDERWHNAIEGYLGNNKLLLVVEPKYAKTAMEIYQDMDKKKFFRAAVLDTEKVQETEWEVKEGALAQELIAKEPYVQAYINFFLGNVIKCESIEELRQNRIGITADCVLYHSFRLQHINPENYTRRAYIGETSMRQRIRRLEEKCESLQEERIPLQEMLEEIRRISQLEGLTQPLEDYRQWLSDLQKIPEKEAERPDFWIQCRSCERNPFWCGSSRNRKSSRSRKQRKQRLRQFRKPSGIIRKTENDSRTCR